MLLSEIKHPKTLTAIKTYNLSEEDITKFKDKSELTKWIQYQLRLKYSRKNPHITRNYYLKHQEELRTRALDRFYLQKLPQTPLRSCGG
jgi:hypothetical protein